MKSPLALSDSRVHSEDMSNEEKRIVNVQTDPEYLALLKTFNDACAARKEAEEKANTARRGEVSDDELFSAIADEEKAIAEYSAAFKAINKIVWDANVILVCEEQA